MTNDEMPKRKSYDLGERTAKFGERVVLLARKIPKTVVNIPIISQFISAGTSVGSNYCEADNAESKNDFKHKIGICKKEAKEAMYWLRIIATAEPSLREEAGELWQEVKELNLIFSSIVNSAKRKPVS
ncbi:MAG: four helix bundle protein [bacterium]|nr:four helix bundle protein [bacterium]